jgi:predicted solute-binding protein
MLIHWGVTHTIRQKVRVCAVSYLNTVPLVWGMLHGKQQGLFDLFFRIPADCADLVASGQADIGIIPCFELLRNRYGMVPGLGIASRGPVRSILLVSKVPAAGIRTLAADSSSRSSVALARILLAEKFGGSPEVTRHEPQLEAMLTEADAALVIGDPALRLDPATLPFYVYDLGREWSEFTGLPMVYAVWAGPERFITPEVSRAFQESCRDGLRSLEEIAIAESPARGITVELGRQYLQQNLICELDADCMRGLDAYLAYARKLQEADSRASVKI